MRIKLHAGKIYGFFFPLIVLLKIMYISVVLQIMLNGKFSQECIFTLVGPFFTTAFICQAASAQQQVNSSNNPSNSPVNNLRNPNGESTSNFTFFSPHTCSKQV